MSARRPYGATKPYSDTSGRTYGSCPRCTEVVTISPSGLVEAHIELLTDPLALGGPCPQGGHYIKTKEDA